MLYLIKYIRGWLASKRKIHEGNLKKYVRTTYYAPYIEQVYYILLPSSTRVLVKYVAMDFIPKFEDSELTHKIKEGKKRTL